MEVKKEDIMSYGIRVIYAGSRNYYDYQKVAANARKFIVDNLGLNNKILFITGDALTGADNLIKIFCQREAQAFLRMPAQWDKFGKYAGYKRNLDMASIATHLVAFWDGTSKGTKHMIDNAAKKGIKTQIVLIDPHKR